MNCRIYMHMQRRRSPALPTFTDLRSTITLNTQGCLWTILLFTCISTVAAVSCSGNGAICALVTRVFQTFSYTDECINNDVLLSAQSILNPIQDDQPDCIVAAATAFGGRDLDPHACNPDRLLPTAQACCTRCAMTRGCIAYTYLLPSAPTCAGACYMKRAGTRRAHHPHAVSGLVTPVRPQLSTPTGWWGIL